MIAEYKNIVLDLIKSWIELENKKVIKYKEEFKGDFIYSFCCYSEFVYLIEYKIKELQRIANIIEEEEFTLNETINLLKQYVETYEKDLLEGSVNKSSTNELVNIGFLWEKKAKQELRKMCIELLSKEKNLN